MKGNNPAILTVLILLAAGCINNSDNLQLTESIKTSFNTGNLTRAINTADSLIKYYSADRTSLRFADSVKQISERIKIDFSVSEEQVRSDLERRTGEITDMEQSFWEENGWLEWRLIDGRKMYFNRAASNLILLRKFYEQKEKRLTDIAADPRMIARLKHTTEIYEKSDNTGKPVVPAEMKITYTISVMPDAVAEGETIRCWMPFPKEGHVRNTNIELLSTSSTEYILAPDSAIHRTVYMESKAEKNKPLKFEISFKYRSYGQYFNLDKEKILPYDKSAAIYKKYTAEQLPHICFTEDLKKLADSITSPADNPVETVTKIYTWFKNNIPWTGALEYSIMPNIPEYVYLNRRGDCGMQTFLFMSMLRSEGIPVRWQSGWMLPPGYENLHDWCEIYYEGIGWVPADISYDLQASENRDLREFYMSGIDSYRMIVNDGTAGPLFPPKKFMRSDPYDFQRGEVEWRGGNLYYDKWDYDIKIEYIK
jgi:hypothetical protein